MTTINKDLIDNVKSYLIYLTNIQKLDIIEIIKKRNADRLQFFNSINLNRLDTNILTQCDAENLVLRNKDGDYIPTLKLLILIKYNDINDLINDLNKEFFSKLYPQNTKPLDGAEKSIILTLLGLLSINNQSAVNITTDIQAEVFKELVEDAKAFLIKHEIVEKDYNIWNRKSKLQNEVQAKIDRLDNIKEKTNNIYSKTKNGHFLNIFDNDSNIYINKVEKLLALLFTYLNYDDKSDLINLLNNINDSRYKLISDGNYQILELQNQLIRIIREWLPY